MKAWCAHISRPMLFITMNSGLIGNIIRSSTSWAGSNFIYSYIKLQPGADPRALDKKLAAFLNHYGMEQMKAIGMQKQLQLQPIASIHTTTDYTNEMEQAGEFHVPVYPVIDCPAYSNHRLYQFYEPVDRKGVQTGEGSGCTKSDWRGKKGSYPAVPGRIPATFAGGRIGWRCPCYCCCCRI